MVEMKEISLIENKMPEIKALGYVRTKRPGATGVGYTLEELFGIEENNDSGADLNGVVELKTARKGKSCRTTSFCQNFLWNYRIRDIIKKYGHRDKEKKERVNFYPSLRVNAKTPAGLSLSIDAEVLSICDDDNITLASIPLSVIIFRFQQKLNKLLLVYADTKKVEGKEYFHYNEAYLCQNPSIKEVIKLLRSGKIVVEPRCYVDTSNDRLRDRGVAFRLTGDYLKELYSDVKKLI